MGRERTWSLVPALVTEDEEAARAGGSRVSDDFCLFP